MESLLTLSLGEYSSVEIVLHLIVVFLGMTTALLALAATTLPSHLRFPLFLTAIALGGAAWFESSVWQSWQEAFELAGTSYCVTGHLLADENRIIAWSLGVPAILFSFGLLLRPSGSSARRHLVTFGLAVFALGIAAPFSLITAGVLFCLIGFLLSKQVAHTLSIKTPLFLALASILVGGILLNILGSKLLLGKEASALLTQGEILRTVTDIFSLVIPGVLLLIGTLRLSSTAQDTQE